MTTEHTHINEGRIATAAARIASSDKIARLRLALTDARVFIAQACEQQILNAEECAPILAAYDKVLEQTA